MKKSKKKKSLTSFSILFLIIIALTVASWLLAGQPFAPSLPAGQEEMVSQVVGAKFSDFFMAPLTDFVMRSRSVFILCLGGFLNIVTRTGALEAGIQHLVKNSKATS